MILLVLVKHSHYLIEENIKLSCSRKKREGKKNRYNHNRFQLATPTLTLHFREIACLITEYCMHRIPVFVCYDLCYVDFQYDLSGWAVVYMTLLDSPPEEIFRVLCFVHYSVLKKYEINSGQHRERDYVGIRAESQEENIFKIQKPLHTFSLFYAVPYYNPNGCSVLYFTKIYFLVSN